MDFLREQVFPVAAVTEPPQVSGLTQARLTTPPPWRSAVSWDLPAKTEVSACVGSSGGTAPFLSFSRFLAAPRSPGSGPPLRLPMASLPSPPPPPRPYAFAVTAPPGSHL